MLTLRFLAPLLPGVYKDLWPYLLKKLTLCDRRMCMRAQMHVVIYDIIDSFAAAKAGYAHLLKLMPMTYKVAECAAAYDQVECVNYIYLQHTNLNCNMIDTAILHNACNVVNYMLQYVNPTINNLEIALECGHISIVRMLWPMCNYAIMNLRGVLSTVCQNGHQDVYDFMLHSGHIANEQDLAYSTRGTLAMFKHVLSLFPNNAESITIRCQAYALMGGKVDILQCIHAIKPFNTEIIKHAATVSSLEWCVSMGIWQAQHNRQHYAPAKYNQPLASMWLIEHGVMLEPDTLWEIAVNNNSTNYANWLITVSQPPEDISRIAAESANVEMLRWLVEHGQPLLHDCYHAAIHLSSVGVIELFKFLIKHLPCENIYYYAIISGRPKVVEWLISNNHACDTDACLQIIDERTKTHPLMAHKYAKMRLILCNSAAHTQSLCN